MEHKKISRDFDFVNNAYLMQSGQRIFFVGISGISMSGLAELALKRGQIVAGSDLHKNERSEFLESIGIEVHSPHSAHNIDNFAADAVVYSAAIPRDNPELLRARQLSIPTIERSYWLGLLNREFPEVINIAGTNGKSTVTAMTAYICMDAGLNPTIHLGAELDRFHSTVHVGGRQLMLSEACEFNYSFLSFSSTITSILNLGHDHVDIFPEMQDVIEAFASYLLQQAPGTKVVLPSFDSELKKMLDFCYQHNPHKMQELDFFFFGYPEDRLIGRPADLLIQNLQFKQGLPHFSLNYRGEDLGQFSLATPGRFNVENAAAAILLSHLAGADFATAKASLATFKGAEGRFTICGHYNDALIVNDYAHHPDSVAKTIEACREIPHQRIIAAFQPITYSRAAGLAKGFTEALGKADVALLLEVYDNREKDHNFSSAEIAQAIKEKGGKAEFFPDLLSLEKYLRLHIQAEDIVLLMGQDIRQIGDRLSERSDHYTGHKSLVDI